MFDFDFGDLLSLAATAADSYSRYQEGQRANEQAKMEADTAETNAKLMAQKEQDARVRASQEADREDQRKRALIGKQRAAMGASGVLVGGGTFADLLDDTEESSREDQQTILMNGMREAYGYQTQRDNFTRSAGAYRRAGSQASQAGTVSAVGGLLSGTYKLGSENRWW